MFNKRDVHNLRPAVCPWSQVIGIQCTKAQDVQRRTAQLLYEVGCNEEGNLMKGQQAHNVILLLIMYYVCVTYLQFMKE